MLSARKQFVMEQPAGGSSVGLLIGPVPKNWELAALAIQRPGHAPQQYKENGQREDTPHAQEKPNPEEFDERHEKFQSRNEEKYKGVEYEGLPGVEPHIGSLVVSPDGQKKERGDGAEVSDCGDQVVRKAGLWGIGHNPSFFGIRSGPLA
jgi:hypothetical protein